MRCGCAGLDKRDSMPVPGIVNANGSCPRRGVGISNIPGVVQREPRIGTKVFGWNS